MKHKDTPHRTIAMPAVRANQIAMAGAYLGVTGHEFIQSAITAALVTLAQNDPTFALMLSRAAGTKWETLEFAERSDVIAQINGTA